MSATPALELDLETVAFYRNVLQELEAAGVPHLVGGAWALRHYVQVERRTKDLDLFVLPADFDRALLALSKAGFPVEVTHPHWLGKAWNGRDFVDVIYSSGNGIVTVDEDWFTYANQGPALGLPSHYCPPEEMVWSKASVMDRARYDGADVAHLIRGCGEHFDWERLLLRFGDTWRVLLSHLVLFGFIYPGERDRVPAWVLRELMTRLGGELDANDPADRRCLGTLLSHAQFRVDVETWGYLDGRFTGGDDDDGPDRGGR